MANNETKTLHSSEDPSGRVIGVDEKLYKDLMNLCDFGDQKWKLVYRASRDGFAAKDFHSKCDDVLNTLTIIKTTNSSIFGGFKLRPIFRENTFIHDPFAVVFSLANKQKKPLLFKLVDEKKAVKYAKNFGPCFGNGDIAITGDSNSSSSSSFCVGTSYQSCTDVPNEYVKEEQLQTTEIEVFQKEFNELTEVNFSYFINIDLNYVRYHRYYRVFTCIILVFNKYVFISNFQVLGGCGNVELKLMQ